MLIDSHCHLNLLNLEEYGDDLDRLMLEARAQGVSHFLTVAVELLDIPVLKSFAARYSDVSFSVGVHPNTKEDKEPDAETLALLANHPACIAIGETGLDYYRVQSQEEQTLQQHRFQEHIEASLITKKPLIVHTRQAADDTIDMLKCHNASEVGGVMHCFAEDETVAQKAMDLNFYISFSGIVTFKNATALQEVAKKIPLDRILIETDAPYLAPVPHRGHQNQPGYVRYVAECLAVLRGDTFENIARATTENFQRCFKTRIY